MEDTKENTLGTLEALITQAASGLSLSHIVNSRNPEVDAQNYRFLGDKNDKNNSYKLHLQEKQDPMPYGSSDWNNLAEIRLEYNNSTLKVSEPKTSITDLNQKVRWQEALLSRVVDLAKQAGVTEIYFNAKSLFLINIDDYARDEIEIEKAQKNHVMQYQAVAEKLGFTFDAKRMSYILNLNSNSSN